MIESSEDARTVIIIFKENELLDSRENYKFDQYIKKGKDLELDFTHVSVIDSLFIGKMILLYKKMEKMGQELRFKNLNSLLKDLFASLRLLPLTYNWE